VFYYLFYVLRDRFFFDVSLFKYITFRTAFSAITAFLTGLFAAPAIIRLLRRANVVEKVQKKDAEKLARMHEHKGGTPTMGGLIIALGVVAAVLLWGDLGNKFVIAGLALFVWLGVVGFVDDYIKLAHPTRSELSKGVKLLGQIVAGAAAACFVYFTATYDHAGDVAIPLFKNVFVPLGLGYIVFAVVVVTGSSNAVNLTDGLDGLAIICTVMATLAFTVICYIVGHAKFAEYLFVWYVPGAGELAVICAAVIGAGLAFLWFNCHPAEVFMGDTGSLPLGGFLGYAAIVSKQELVLAVVGGIFVVEALSVLWQVFWFKRTGGKRFFECTPLHHHFEYKKVPETKIVVRFAIVAAVLAAFSVALLKLR